VQRGLGFLGLVHFLHNVARFSVFEKRNGGRKERFLLELSRASDFLCFDRNSSEYPDELNEGEDGGEDGDGEHVPHHHHLFPWSGDPAWNFSVLGTSEIVHFTTVSADVLFWDIPRGKTGLLGLLLLEEVVKVDEDDFEDELGDQVGDVPHSDLRSPDDLSKSADVSRSLDLFLLKSELLLLLVDLGVLRC